MREAGRGGEGLTIRLNEWRATGYYINFISAVPTPAREDLHIGIPRAVAAAPASVCLCPAPSDVAAGPNRALDGWLEYG